LRRASAGQPQWPAAQVPAPGPGAAGSGKPSARIAPLPIGDRKLDDVTITFADARRQVHDILVTWTLTFLLFLVVLGHL